MTTHCWRRVVTETPKAPNAMSLSERACARPASSERARVGDRRPGGRCTSGPRTTRTKATPPIARESPASPRPRSTTLRRPLSVVIWSQREEATVN
jgi:hypothetical protein